MKIRHPAPLAVLFAFVLCWPMLPGEAGGRLAAAQTAPAKAGWYPHLLDTAAVKQYTVLPKRKDVAIVDARPTTRKYDVGHIPTAISLPDSQFEQLAPKLLPADRSQLVIFYCDGPDCILSHQSAFRAEKLGYTNVRVYAGGFPEWVRAGNVPAVSVAYLRRLMDERAPLTLIDARPKERKYDKGHIPGAISLPDSQFEQFAAQRLPAEKAAPLYFYCDGLACKLSSDSAEKAVKLGYTNVKVVPEGWPAWERAYGGVAAASAIVAGKEPGSISVASFERIYREAPDSVHLVDVRDPAEFAAGTFKGAVNMPVGSIEKNLDRLPAGKPIVFFCGAGSRSGEAHDIVKAARPDLKTFFLDARTKWSATGEPHIAGN